MHPHDRALRLCIVIGGERCCRSRYAAKRQKKEPPEKRQNEMGRTVPYSRQPSQKVQERMERAMPGAGPLDAQFCRTVCSSRPPTGAGVAHLLGACI